MARDLKPRVRKKLMKCLKTGVVPLQGIYAIQVGRHNEIKAIMKDLDDIKEGSTSVRVIIGEYGSGKTFLLSLARELAHVDNICVCNVDLSPEKRLYSTKGHGRRLYSDLVRTLSIKSRPEGGALRSIVETYLSQINVKDIYRELDDLKYYALGPDFISVLLSYKEGFDSDDNFKINAAFKWISGEYNTKLEARQDLNIRTIIHDNNYYSALKVLNSFLKIAGFSGLLLHFDEMVNLLRISHTQTRKNNYEQLLSMVNDLLQANLSNIGIYFSGTPDFLTNEYRGLYSYEALKGRLRENEFLDNNTFDLNHPVIRLKCMTKEEIYNLIDRLGNIYELDDSINTHFDFEMNEKYVQWCSDKLGADLFTSPRELIKSYLDLRDVMESNSSKTIEDTLGMIDIRPDEEEEESINYDDDMVEMNL